MTYMLPMEYGVFVEDFKRQVDRYPVLVGRVMLPMKIILSLIRMGVISSGTRLRN